MTVDWLDALDLLRLESPKSAAEQAVASIEKLAGNPGEYARLCGIYGSALRAMARLPEAYEAIREGLRFADLAGELDLRAELMQRYGIVFAEEGKYEAAFRCADEAIGLYLVSGQLNGVGKALVDKAGWHFHLQQFSQVGTLNQQALSFLNRTEETNRLAALLGLAYCYRAVGELDLAKSQLRKAWDEVRSEIGQTLFLSFQWLEGEIEFMQGNFTRAVDIFASLVAAYRRHEMFLDAATAAVELVRILALSGRVSKASQVAGSLLWLIAPLKPNRIASAALLELLRAGRSGENLQLAAIESWKIQLEKARQPPARIKGVGEAAKRPLHQP